MEFLINPNIAYIIVAASGMLALITILIPGTGLPEVGLVLCLSFAWFEFAHLPPTPWALSAMVLSVVPFLLAIRLPRLRLSMLVLTILMLTGGSVFMFVDENGWPAVHPVLAGTISVLIGGFIWLAVDRAMKIHTTHPNIDPDMLVGQVGEARTAIHASGSVQIHSELWSARSEQPIPKGVSVRILRREGFVLVVEAVTTTFHQGEK